MIYPLFLFLIYSTLSELIDKRVIRTNYHDFWPILEHSPYSFLFLTDNDDSIKFSLSSIQKYGNITKYFIASPKEFPNFDYNQDPSVIFFKYNKSIQLLFDYPIDSQLFLDYSFYYIKHYRAFGCPKFIPKLFNGDQSFLIEVDDYDQNPEASSQEIDFIYMGSSKSLRYYAKIDIKKPGLYSYRHQDKRMLYYNGSFRKQVSSNLIHYSNIPKKSTKLVFSFIIDFWGEKCSKEYEMLEQLSSFYGIDNYYYSLIHISEASEIIPGAGIYDIKRSFFIIFNNSIYPTKKWIFEYDINNNKYLLDNLMRFTSDVISNNKPTTIISAKFKNNSNSNSLKSIVHSNFEYFVYNDSIDSVVLFHSVNCLKCKVILPLVKGINKIVDNDLIRFFSFNASNNDIPVGVPEIESYPTLILWKKGMKDKPVVYSGEYTFNGILNFIKDLGTQKYKKPNLDSVKNSFNSIKDKFKKFMNDDDDKDL